LTSKTPWSKDAYFQAYRDSFSRGEYNKQESVNTSRGIIIRNYFSGGFAMPENVSGVFIPMEDEDSVKVLFDLAQGRIVDVTVGAGTRDISSRDGGIRRFLDQLNFEDVFKKMNDFFGIDIDAAKEIDPKLAGISFDGKENRLGWTPAMIEWIFAHPETVESVLADAEAIRAKKYEYVIFCGMGGSGLSVQAVRSMFARPDDDDMRIYSLRTTDPAAIKEILDEITWYENDDIKQALKHTLIIPISKSGTTAETVTHKEYFEKLYADVFKDDPTVDIREHMWVMTDKGSSFDKKVYPQRDIQLNGAGDVGGRFTAPTTRIFLMPLALVNPDMVWSVLRKARGMHNQADLSSNDFVHLGAFLYHMAEAEHKDKVTFLFPEKLRDLVVWAEQLVEESLGKDGKGITLFYGEDIRFYEELKPVEENDRVFVRFNLGDDKSDERFWDEITDEGYPVWEIDINDISEIGGVMLGLQLAVATVGYLWDIRYVDQPGVEGYKRSTREVQAEVQPGNKIAPPDSWKYASRGSLRLYYDMLYSAGISPQEIRAEVERLGATMEDAAAVFAAVLKISAGTEGFQAAEIASYGRMTPEAREVFEDARRRIFTQFLRIPAKLGEGPDKNHSYHQNIAQGREQFLSIYYLPDVFPQPAHVSYDDNLIRAQEIGTVQSLADGKRKVVLLTSAGSMDESAGDLADFFDQVKLYLGIIDKAVVQRAKFERLRARMDDILADAISEDDILADAPGVIEIINQMGDLGRHEAVKYLMEHRCVEGDDPMYQELRQAAAHAVVKIMLDTGNRSALQAVLYNDPFIGLRHLRENVSGDESKIVSGDESKLKQYISYFPAFTDLLEKELGDSLRSGVSIPDDITREWIENILSVLQKAKNDPVLSVDSDKDGGVMKPGGIDLRALPIIAQSMAAAGKALPGVDVRQLQALAAKADIADMDAEWRRIMRDISKESSCYENLRQFIAVCRVRNDAGHLKAVSDWLKRTLMLEEENSVSTPRVMMELLYLAG
jgi:glucose-6-phosphate isomerase